MADIKPLDTHEGGVTIGCAVCLNQRGKRETATTIVNGYAVCDAHVELVSRPDFDIQRLRSSPGEAF